MSLVGLAMRLSAVKALANATIAGGRIFDSAVLPIDKLAPKSGPAPFVAISTEDEGSNPSGRDLNNGDRRIDLVIECAIGQIVPLPGEDGEGLAVSETDANLELSLAVLSRQIDACLFGQGGGVWGEVFRAFVKTIEETISRRGLPAENGERFAARQVAYRVKAFAEPAFGALPADGTPFAKFLAALDDAPGMENIAEIIRQSIAGHPIGWPDVYTRGAVDGGLTEDEARKIGIASAGNDPVEALTLAPDGPTYDQAGIDAQLPDGGDQ